MVGEELAQIPEVKIVCNSELDLADFLVAGGRDTALKERWNQVDVAAEALLKQQGDFVKEAGLLLKNHYGTVILDKAHKARIKGGVGQDAMQFNNLLAFMHLMDKRTRHLILGTATPIQTHVRELWDLLGILNSGAEFVLGDALSPWQDYETAIPMVTGQSKPLNEEQAWHWLNNPLPPGNEHHTVQNIRDLMGVVE